LLNPVQSNTAVTKATGYINREKIEYTIVLGYKTIPSTYVDVS